MITEIIITSVAFLSSVVLIVSIVKESQKTSSEFGQS